MKKLTAIGLILLLSACAGTEPEKNQISPESAKYEDWKLNRHVEKSSSLRGTFCNGEGYKWYYEGKYAISGTCENGMVFHLPLREHEGE